MARALPQALPKRDASAGRSRQGTAPAPARPVTRSSASASPSGERAPCACGGGCPRCRGSPTDGYEQQAHLMAARLLSGSLSPASDTVIHVSPSPLPDTRLGSGGPLPFSLRTAWEPALGADLSAVRVHSGATAASIAAQQGAHAFAYGSHIVLGADVGSFHTSFGRAVLAHELAHTVQQTSMSPRVQRFDVTWDDVENAASSAWQGVRAAPGRIYDAAVDTAQDVAQFGYEQLLSMLEEYAPEFMAFLRAGPVNFIKERAFEALDSLLGGLITQIRRDGLTATLRSLFGEGFGTISTIVSDLAAGDCSSLFTAISTVMDFARTTFGPIVNELRGFATAVGGFFNGVWNRFGQPVADFISGVAGGFWDGLVSLAESFWTATQPIRSAVGELWEEFKRRFNLAWDSGVGIVEWLTQKAGEAWDAIKRELGPMLVPLEILVGVLLLLSPLGPVVTSIAIYYGISQAISWLYDNWGSVRQWFIDARETLQTQVFPVLMGGLEAASNALGTAADWISEQIGRAASAIRRIATALGLAPLMDTLTGLVSNLATDAEQLASWAAQEFTEIVNNVRQVLRQIHQTLRPLYGLILAIVIFPYNPFLLPVVLAGWFWRLTPDCIKEPVIDWVIELMRSAIQAMPAFSNFGEWWPQARTRIITTLDQIAAMPMEQKVAASNRIARMMTLEDVEWIGNLVAAAIEMPNHFIGQMQEELLGMNLGQPLPFERAAVPGGTSAITGGPAMDAAQASSVEVDSVVPFDVSPELLMEAGLVDDGEVTLAGADPAWANLAAIRSEAAATSEGSGPPGPVAAGAEPAPESAMTPEQDTEARLQALIDAPMEEGCPGNEAPQPAAQSEQVPEEMKFGPLTQAQRGRYLLAQMGKGLRKWFDCNKAWLIPSIILVIVALIALEIITGGAVTAALPAIFEILSAIMIGVAAVRSAYYVGEYIAKAAPGDIAGGATSLARGMAVAAIEIVFALLFNLGAVIKSLRGGLRAALRDAAGAMRAFGRTTVEATQTLGRVAFRGAVTAAENVGRVAGAIVRRGRIVMEGLSDGIGRGVRSLRDLGRRLSRLRFRRFALRRRGRHIQVWAEINPWVLLADGTLEDVTFAGSGGRAGIGMEASVGRRTGVVVGVQGRSSYVRQLEGLTDAQRRARYRELSRASEAERRAVILQAGQTAENARILRANMTRGGVRPGRGTPGGGNAAHHIVPSTSGHASAEQARAILASAGIDINHALNGVFLPQHIHAPLHTGAYMMAVRDALRPVQNLPTLAARQARARRILDGIATRILNGRFP